MNHSLTLSQATLYADLMEHYGSMMNNLCMLQARNLDEAKQLQLVAENAVWNAVAKLPSHARTNRRWFFTVVRHAFIDHYRKKRKTVSLDQLTAPSLLSIDTRHDDTTAMRETIDEISAHLAPNELHIINRIIEGYTTQEIAQELGISYDSMRQRKHRTIQKMIKIRKELYG